MNVSNDASTPSAPGGVDRRIHHHLREVFDQAYQVAEPILGSSVSSSAHFLRITLHDAFPHLHQQDISILCVAIERVHREKKRTSS